MIGKTNDELTKELIKAYNKIEELKNRILQLENNNINNRKITNEELNNGRKNSKATHPHHD